MAAQNKPSRTSSTTKCDATGEAPSLHDPILLVVHLNDDVKEISSASPPSPPSQRPVTKTLKIRRSESLLLPNGRSHYSALALRQRLARWTGNAFDTDYDVVSSKSKHVIGLPNGTGNENILDLFGSRFQLRVKLRPIRSTSVLFQIQGRHYDFDGTLTVGGTTLRFVESANRPNQGTSYNVWDGALLMARYLEQYPQAIKGHRVLELGSGCGVAGLSAAALGACFVTLTDLPGLVLEHLQANIDCNDEILMEHCRVEARSCDWRCPPAELVSGRKYDVVLVSDCVWVEELVDPLFDVLRMMTRTAVADEAVKEFATGSTMVHHSDEGGNEEATESTTPLCNEKVEERASRTLPAIGKHTRDERTSDNLDESTHHKFELGFLERSNPMGQSTCSVDKCEEFASFYEDDITATRVIITYQRRGKSTHELFMGRLCALFNEIEVVAIAHQPEIFTIFSCQR